MNGHCLEVCTPEWWVTMLRAVAVFGAGAGLGLAALIWRVIQRMPIPHWGMWLALITFTYTLSFTFLARLSAFSHRMHFGFQDVGAFGIVVLTDLTLWGLLGYYRTSRHGREEP